MLKLKILIVDDSVTIRKLVEDAFEKRGYRVLSAASGEDALEIILREHPDLIISDIAMPGMDGWDLCGQVRTNPYTSFIPFVFLSKKSEAPDRIKGLQMGADDYITKPFNMEELLARVELIFNRMAKAQEAAYSKEKGLSGSTRDMALSDLLQMFQANRKTGILKIIRKTPREEGKIAFSDGGIINANLKTFSPVKAVQRMLAWEEAKFELEPLVLDSAAEQPQNLSDSLGVEGLLLESFRVQDELARLKKARPIKEVNIQSEALRNLNALSENQKKILVRSRRATKIDDLMDIEDITDLEAYEVIVDLVERGFLKQIE